MPLSRAFAIALAVPFLLLPRIGWALDVTTCGQVVPTGATGVLQNDLACTTSALGCYECAKGTCFPTGVTGCAVDADCASPNGQCAALPAVAIDTSATLDMNGHAIVAPDSSAVMCRSNGPCTVTSTSGRGDISGSGVGIVMRSGKLTVSHVDVHDNGSGIYSPLISVRMRLTDVTANGNGGIGIRASNLQADGVTANGNGQLGIEANGKIRGTNVTTNDNAWAGTLAGKGAKLAGFTATGNGIGTDRGGAGLIVGGGAAKLTGGTITGNLFDDGSGPAPLDVLTVRKPKLAGTTCGHSARYDRKTGDLGPTWGVCAGD
jgi:hypothetical protein